MLFHSCWWGGKFFDENFFFQVGWYYQSRTAFPSWSRTHKDWSANSISNNGSFSINLAFFPCKTKHTRKIGTELQKLFKLLFFLVDIIFRKIYSFFFHLFFRFWWWIGINITWIYRYIRCCVFSPYKREVIKTKNLNNWAKCSLVWIMMVYKLNYSKLYFNKVYHWGKEFPT